MHFSTSPILSVGDPYKRVILTRSLLGKVHLGEITRTSSYFPRPELLAALPEEATEQAKNLLSAQQGVAQRLLVRTGNFEMTNEHFNWVSDFEMRSRTEPEWAVLFERLTWGRFYGLPKAFLVDGASIAESPEAVWNEFNRYHHEVRERWKQRRALEIKIIGKVDHALEKDRLKLRGVELETRETTRNHGPTFGIGGILWASLTLALLTLPVVIVATEEALAAVPGWMPERSYACGASKWQTIRRIVLPWAMPGIMTGAILAMARGAGEVAPLMLVGAIQLRTRLKKKFIVSAL